MRVYLDHNATTPLRPKVREILVEALERYRANPSSVHAAGRAARQAIDEARERVAAALDVHEDEVVFTAGGTAANNLALLGSVLHAPPGAGLVTSASEHSAILEPAQVIEDAGRPVTRLAVDREGRVDLGALPRSARHAALVSLQAANNEVGTCIDLAAIASALDELDPRPLLHTDAVQALGRVHVDLRAARVDLATFSAHKLGGPLGVGVLYRRHGSRLVPLTRGGGQEAGLWPGTENVPAIVAAAAAFELAVREREHYAEHTSRLAALLWRRIREGWPDARLFGRPLDASDRLPNTLNVAFPHVDGRVLVTRLDLAGLEVSAGSACASGSLEPSHVLRAMGFDDEHARAGLRLSLGSATTEEDIHTTVEILRKTLL